MFACFKTYCYHGVFLLFLSSTQIFSITFIWEPKNKEPAFSLDVPDTWRQSYAIKDNGAIVYFAYKQGLIEVKTFTQKKPDLQDLVNSKIARLVTEYKDVRILDSQKIRFRKNTFIITWEFISEEEKYFEQHIIILDANKVLSISCIVPSRLYPKYKVTYENALYSIYFLEDNITNLEKIVQTNEVDKNKVIQKKGEEEKK